MVPGCMYFCTKDQVYCERHLVVKCNAITKKGRPCREKAISRSSPFCKDHLHLRPMQEELLVDQADDEMTSTNNNNDNKHCAAVTTKGTKCTEIAILGSSYCYEHSLPQTATDIETVISSDLHSYCQDKIFN